MNKACGGMAQNYMVHNEKHAIALIWGLAQEVEDSQLSNNEHLYLHITPNGLRTQAGMHNFTVS